MNKTGILLISSIALSFTAIGQDTLPPQRFITVQHDNDYLHLLGQGTDRYYTAGNIIRYSYLDQRNDRFLTRLLLAPRKPVPSFVTVGLTQWMYTPADLSQRGIIKGDYPYAGVLFLQFTREKLLTPRRLFKSELWIGVMGPPSLAKPAQSLVHNITGDVLPKGWNYQMPSYPVLNYQLHLNANMFSFSRSLKMNGWLQAQAGTLLNNAETGLTFAYSTRKDDYFPDRVYALNRNEAKRGWRFFVQFMPAVRFVGTNAILQGNTFHQWFGEKPDYYIDRREMKRVLWKWTGVLGLQWNSFTVQYTQAWQRKEFRTVLAHTYGSVNLTWRMRARR